MKLELSRIRCLEDELFALYQRCKGEGCPHAAEHLMQAIEELAKDRPGAQETVDRAYLWAVRAGGRAVVPLPDRPSHRSAECRATPDDRTATRGFEASASTR